MNDDRSFWQVLAGGAILILLGVANLALGTEPRLFFGWGAAAFGLVGVGVAVGLRAGWITPRQRTTRARRPATPEPAAAVEHPQLSEPGRRELARIVAELHAAGVLAPDPPDPTQLQAAVTDQGEPVTVEAVLAALDEASWYYPGFRAEPYTANLVRHDVQVEQPPDVLRRQINDLVRVAGGALIVVVDDIRQDATGRTRIRWSVNGTAGTLDYAGASKHLSSVIHVALARAAAGAPRRLAGFWTDQALWITTLPAGGVERLNATLGADDPGSWEWLDAQSPLAAGDVG